MKLLKFSLFILLSFVLTSCGKRLDTSSSSPAKAYLLAQQINSAATGNCAISINHAGLTYGTYVSVAINDGKVSGINSSLSSLDSITSGVFSNYATSNNIPRFTQAEYEAASGSTVAEQGYSSYADVPFNAKYDAFFKEGGSWTASKRLALLNFAKDFVDSFAPYTLISTSPTLASQAFNALPNLQGQIQDTYISVAFNPNASNRNSLINNLSSVLTNNQQALQGSGAIGLQKQVNGTAALACARIPRSSCSVAGLTTANREADIKFNTDVVNAIFNNPSCQITSEEMKTNMLHNAFIGLPIKTPVETIVGKYERPTNATSLPFADSTVGFTTATKILAQSAYPKFGSLVSLGFGNLMPINKTNDSYILNSNEFRFGKNLEAKVVDSCESIGLNKGITVLLPDSQKQSLTSTPEIAYALSVSGTAASYYAQVSFSFSAIPCNSSFREQFQIPLPLGGGKLPKIFAASGDGEATSLLSICVYGGSANTRNFPKNLLAAGLGLQASQIPECGSGVLETFKSAQKDAAGSFSELGNITDFPNSQP